MLIYIRSTGISGVVLVLLLLFCNLGAKALTYKTIGCVDSTKAAGLNAGCGDVSWHRGISSSQRTLTWAASAFAIVFKTAGVSHQLTPRRLEPAVSTKEIRTLTRAFAEEEEVANYTPAHDGKIALQPPQPQHFPLLMQPLGLTFLTYTNRPLAQ